MIREFSNLRLDDAEDAGGKGANLGELCSAGLPVPPGFVLLRDCYQESMSVAGYAEELASKHRDALAAVADNDKLTALCHELQETVGLAGIDPQVREDILDAYHRLGDNVPVAVRSSATGEDGKDASFAGMNRTLTDVVGDVALLDAVSACWQSLFGPRVVAYRATRGFTDEPAMAVVVQQMVASQRSGVAFTADPSTGARDRVAIEAALGLGEVVVSGMVQPDTYIIDKSTGSILETYIGHQDFRIVRGTDGVDHTEDLDEDLAQPGPRRRDRATDRRARAGRRGPVRLPAGSGMGDRSRRRGVAGTGTPDHHPRRHLVATRNGSGPGTLGRSRHRQRGGPRSELAGRRRAARRW